MKEAYFSAIPSPGDQGANDHILSIDFLSFERVQGKIQLLHVDLWYKDGSTSEINLTSPFVPLTEDRERQYLYLRMYLQKSARDLGIVAYQASMVRVKNGELKVFAQYDKVDCSSIPPFKPGQFCEHD